VDLLRFMRDFEHSRIPYSAAICSSQGSRERALNPQEHLSEVMNTTKILGSSTADDKSRFSASIPHEFKKLLGLVSVTANRIVLNLIFPPNPCH